MKIKINNQEKEVSSKTVRELVTELGLEDKGIAVAVNGTMVPRAEWESAALTEGAVLLIIRAACGG